MHPDPGPVVIIGLKEIYDAVTELKGTVAMLVHTDTDRGKDITDHEARLRQVEEAQPSRRLTRLEEQVEMLKASRWPLPSLAALLSLGALAVAVIPLLRG